VATIGDGQALDLMKPLNASVADSKQAIMPRVEEAGNQEGEWQSNCQSLWSG
jgi:hypothetical protein